MQTPVRPVRIEDDLVAEARAASPDLADASLTTLVRVALAVLAGRAVVEGVGKLVSQYGDRKPPGRPRKVK